MTESTAAVSIVSTSRNRLQQTYDNEKVGVANLQFEAAKCQSLYSAYLHG